MTDLLGLRGITAEGPVLETPDLIQFSATLPFLEPPICPACKHTMTKNGMEQIAVKDAPMRGKRVRIHLRKERRRCRPCREQRTAISDDLRPGYHVVTRRMVRHVENRVLKTTIADVARDVGLTEDHVASIARALDARLQRSPSHWETPDAIAIDNIQVAKGFRFQVLYDQIAGRPMAMAPTWSLRPIRDEALRHLEVDRVRVFSSDMSDVNLSLGEVFTNAIHVADRFHVVMACVEAVGSVYRKRIDELEEQDRYSEAAALRVARAEVIGAGTTMPDVQQPVLELAAMPESGRHDDVSAADRVLPQLGRFYASRGTVEAWQELQTLYCLMEDRVVAATMRPALNYIRGHQAQVLAYFDALDLIGRDPWSPTTNGLERRNGTLQAIWGSARAYRDVRLFRLRAIYHPYTIGLHLLDCSACGGVAGPLDHAQVLALSQSRTPPPALCRHCRPATPDSAESTTSSPEYGVAA